MSRSIQYQLEYPIHTSIKFLYPYVSTADGLQQWFADKVIIQGKEFVFQWDGSEQKAKLLHKKPFKSIRFKCAETPDDTFFEFAFHEDPLTRNVSLIITDFAAGEQEKEEATRMWNSQVEELFQHTGL